MFLLKTVSVNFLRYFIFLGVDTRWSHFATCDVICLYKRPQRPPTTARGSCVIAFVTEQSDRPLFNLYKLLYNSKVSPVPPSQYYFVEFGLLVLAYSLKVTGFVLVIQCITWICKSMIINIFTCGLPWYFGYLKISRYRNYVYSRYKHNFCINLWCFLALKYESLNTSSRYQVFI